VAYLNIKQTPATLLNHNTHYQPVTGTTRGPAAPSAALPTQIISPPTKLSSHFPSKSVPLPARGRHSARVPSTVNLSHQGSHTMGRHNRREQRDSAPLPRSSLLEEFRNNRNKRWELQVCHICHSILCRDPYCDTRRSRGTSLNSVAINMAAVSFNINS
jgi:hypothetical protein